MKNSIHCVLGFSAFLFAACGGGAAESSEAASTTGGEHCDHCEHHGEHGEHAHCEHCEHAADGTHSATCACEHHGEGHGGEHGEHGGMPAEVAALHDELAPVFHMEAGAARNTATCEHAAGFRTHATAIAAATTPEGADAAAWSSATASLGTSADALVTDCGAGGANAEAQLESFHTAFHAVMEAAGGHHGEHGEHEHGEHEHGEHEHH